jgi:hypothetical protein
MVTLTTTVEELPEADCNAWVTIDKEYKCLRFAVVDIAHTSIRLFVSSHNERVCWTKSVYAYCLLFLTACSSMALRYVWQILHVLTCS